MLCPKCDAIRFPSANMQVNSLNAKKASSSAKTNAASKPNLPSSADAQPNDNVAYTHIDNSEVKVVFENAVSVNSAADD